MSVVTRKKFKHFSHEHPLSLVQLQYHHNNKKSDKDEDEDENEDKDKDKDDIVVEEGHVGKCKMCEEEIYSFHLCYYTCEYCDYSLHILCAQLPETQHNHPLHPDHNLTLSLGYYSSWMCDLCKTSRNRFYSYHCSICDFDMDVICATMSEQRMDHPSHPHQLQRYFRQMMSRCSACGDEHTGTFYNCTTCFWSIHLDCALLPPKLLIQQYTNESFSHPHLLNLAYSFPYIEREAKFNPRCRVCDLGFECHLWHYRCNKCRYYVHVPCATSTREAFMSILGQKYLGKTSKNFKDDDHPNLIRYPFPDESVNLLMHMFINKGELVMKEKIDGEMFSHPHLLILVDTLLNKSVSLHDPMKRVELLCDGCVRPITDIPFYKCSKHDCGFVLHEWCTRLPFEIQGHHSHPQHTLVLLMNISTKLFGMFKCEICGYICNGFAYGCRKCGHYVDINCAFVPDVITHEAHPNHLLIRNKSPANQSNKRPCNACGYLVETQWFNCPTCDFYLHIECAVLLPKTIRHKYDKHPMSLRYYPAENHDSEYFCEICEDEFNPEEWFYHCSICDLSMHTACAPVKLQCEQSTCHMYNDNIFRYINVKFGGRYKIRDHLHPVTFVQGIKYDGKCTVCDEKLKCKMIFKCFECMFALHRGCVRDLSNLVALP